MWVFLEFLSDILLALIEIKNNAKNPLFWYICFFWIILILVVVFYFENLHLALILFLLSVLNFLLYINFFHKAKKIQSIIINDVELVESKEVFSTTYSDMFSFSDEQQKFINSKDNQSIKIRTPKIAQPIALTIHGKLVECNNISHLKALFFWIVFETKISNHKNEKWLIRVRFWGIFKPKIILYVSKF